MGPIALLIDSGPLYAYADADDQFHEKSLSLLSEHPGPLLVPVLCIAEVSYLLGQRVGSGVESRFIGDLASGAFVVEPVDLNDWPRIRELIWTYRDLPLGTVDASIVAAAERLNITTIATLDRRHFTVVRPSHATAFELLPEL